MWKPYENFHILHFQKKNSFRGNNLRKYGTWISGKRSRCLHEHHAPTENISIHCSFSFQPKGKKVLRNLSYVLCQVEVLAFLFAFLMAGILWGYLENFLFWHLEDLGATKFLMGTYWKIYYLSKSDHFLNFNEFVLFKVKHCCRLKSLPVGVAEFSALQQVYIPMLENVVEKYPWKFDWYVWEFKYV